jgi:hypothetical protein
MVDLPGWTVQKWEVGLRPSVPSGCAIRMWAGPKFSCGKFAALTLAKRAIPIAVEHEVRRHGYVVADPWKCSSARTNMIYYGQNPLKTSL